MEKIIHECNCQLKLEGNSEIPADVLCGVLSNILVVAEKTKSKEVDRIQYMVKATSKGSFLMDLAVIAESVMPPLIASGPDIINMASNSLEILSELFNLKTFLKGEKPKTVEERQGCVAVTNNEGTIQIFNIAGDFISNPQIDKAITGIGNSLSDGNVPSMTISDVDNEEDIVEVTEEDYPYIKQPIAPGIRENIFENTVDVEFTAKKPDLQGKSKWGIMLDGRCIQASIEDDEWIKKVQQGLISVNSKKVIKAKMKITQKADKYNVPIAGTEKYYILKVYRSDNTEEYPQLEIEYEK